ncbi:hypothetical protein [Enterobacter roggenkampii]|uniref:hypothetical protein n=1 Tax=Enterobacter roggenkampii TaxID=1812935 RepID=UPI002A83A140|nr:hypothetical protein [Enterobacter roggenkampii]
MPYFFTHELGTGAFTAVATSGLLLAGSLTRMAREGTGSDITRSHINPVFTRVLSLDKTGAMQSVKRLAIRENLVGANNAIVIFINSDAVEKSHARALSYANQHGYGDNIFDKSVAPGYYRSYMADAGKTGASSQQERSPSEIAVSSDYRYSNEQHWNVGIDLRGNVAGVAIKVEKVGNTWVLARGRGSGKALWKAGSKKNVKVDDYVRQAIRDARKLTADVWLVGPATYLEDVAVLLQQNSQTAGTPEQY